jgi:hypothetical protein
LRETGLHETRCDLAVLMPTFFVWPVTIRIRKEVGTMSSVRPSGVILILAENGTVGNFKLPRKPQLTS